MILRAGLELIPSVANRNGPVDKRSTECMQATILNSSARPSTAVASAFVIIIYIQFYLIIIYPFMIRQGVVLHVCRGRGELHLLRRLGGVCDRVGQLGLDVIPVGITEQFGMLSVHLVDKKITELLERTTCCSEYR